MMNFLGWEDIFSDAEMMLLERFFIANSYRYNPGNIQKRWYDEENLLCVRYNDDCWWHYNIVTSEWW